MALRQGFWCTHSNTTRARPSLSSKPGVFTHLCVTGAPHPYVPSHRIQHEKAGGQGQGQGVECCEGQIERDCLSEATLAWMTGLRPFSSERLLFPLPMGKQGSGGLICAKNQHLRGSQQTSLLESWHAVGAGGSCWFVEHEEPLSLIGNCWKIFFFSGFREH